MSTDIWKRRPKYRIAGPETNEDVRVTWAGPISTKLYGDNLQELSRMTHNNLMRIRSSMMRFDPCLEYGIEHWHPESRPCSAQSFRPSPPDPDKVSWHAPSVMFASYDSLNTLTSQSTMADSDTLSVASSKAPSNFCYLCSTVEEHIQHQNRLKLGRRMIRPAKPRIKYIAPPPVVRVTEPNPTEAQEVLYRIDVFTGAVADAGTTANVYITLHGKGDSSLRTRLKRGTGAARFCFMRGSTETFYYKGPKIGDLTFITVEHELPKQKGSKSLNKQVTHDTPSIPRAKRDYWYLDKVVVTNMKTDQSWTFICSDWLSREERDLEAVAEQKTVRELDITVVTGNKQMAGTDAKIHLTLYSSRGMSRKIYLKNDKNKDMFQRGKEDMFRLTDLKDLGVLKKIKVEHDGSGLASGWYLDKVIVQDPNQAPYHYEFHYGGWIAKGEGEGHLYRMIRARTKQDKEVKRGEKIRYLVSVTTGDVRYAGTDANVFIQFVGSKGTTEPKQIDDARDNFERGMTEHFHLQAIDVGPLSRIIVSHDNSGPGSGWYLEDVTVKRYMSKSEKADTLRRMKKFVKEQPAMRKKRLAEKMNEEDEKKEKGGSDENSESSSDEDDTKSRKSTRSAKSSDMDYAEEVFDRDGKPMKIPDYEEYYFVCKAWLATDEGDGRTSRELTDPERKRFFKDIQ